MEAEIKCCSSAPSLNTSVRFGEGLPYAPEDWPCPGDKWRWSVGRRISNSGFFTDKYLFPPKYLPKLDNARTCISGKQALKKYIKKWFPDKDVDAFFASFSWKIPAKNFSLSRFRAGSAPRLSKKHRKIKEHENDDKSADEEEESADDDDDEEWVKEQKAYPTSTRKRKREPVPISISMGQTRPSFKHSFPSNIKTEPICIDYSQELESEPSSYSSSKDNTKKYSKSENDQVSSHSLIGTSHSHANLQESLDAYHKPFETNSEDRNLSIVPFAENKVDESQRQLASLLAMEPSHLITTENLAKLKNVLVVIRENSHLSSDQLLKLHRIEEITLLGRCFLEVSQEIEHDQCFQSLLPNIAKIISMIHCYNQCKDKAAQMQTDIQASLLAKHELEEKIAKLQTQHAHLLRDIDHKISVKHEDLSTQGNTADLVHGKDCEIGSAKNHELETRKAEEAKRVAEIVSKYSS